jgi:hypothetical protein
MTSQFFPNKLSYASGVVTVKLVLFRLRGVRNEAIPNTKAFDRFLKR